MSFLQNCEVCFNQESLPITYHNFRHKNWARPKIKLKRISSHKMQGQFFTERSNSASWSHKITKLIKISGRKLRSYHSLHPKWPKITNIHFATTNCSFGFSLKVTKISRIKVWSDPTANFQSISYKANPSGRDNIY